MTIEHPDGSQKTIVSEKPKGLGIAASLLGLAVIVVLESGPLSAAEGELPQAIRTALEQYSADLEPITLSWRNAKGRIYTFARQGNCVYGSWRDIHHTSRGQIAQPNKQVWYVSENAFDGEIVYRGAPTMEPGGLTAVLIKRPLSMCLPGDVIKTDYLTASGFWFPGSFQESLGVRIRSVILYQLEKGGQLVEVREKSSGGRKTVEVVLKSPTFATLKARQTDLTKLREYCLKEGMKTDEIEEAIARCKRCAEEPDRLFTYCLDPQMNYAVLSWERADLDKNVLDKYENSQFQQMTGRAVWLPKKSECSLGTGRRDVLELLQVDVSPIQESRFVLDYRTPGTYVTDGTLPDSAELGEISYVIPASEDDLLKVIEAAIAAAKERGPPEAQWSLRRIVILAASVLLLCVVGMRIWLSSRRHRPTS